MSKETLQLTLFNNSLERYLLSVAVFIITMIALKLFDSIFLNLLRAKAEKTSGRFDDILTRTLQYTLMPIFYFAAFYAAARSLSLTPALSRGIKAVHQRIYYVNENDYNFYMDTQQAININIKKEVALQGIEFVYPSQTLFLQK